MTYRLDHIHLRSADPGAAEAFYVHMFEAEALTPATVKGVERRTVRLAGTLLFIEQAPEDAACLPDPPVRGLEHFCLAVEGLMKLAEELRARGVVFAAEPRLARPGLRTAFVQAPDNVRIELVDRNAGTETYPDGKEQTGVDA